jgi:hypothetical protein
MAETSDEYIDRYQLIEGQVGSSGAGATAG